MRNRKIIKNKWLRCLFSPLALLQWIVYSSILSPVVLSIGLMFTIAGTIIMSKEYINTGCDLICVSAKHPMYYLKFYILYGEIGLMWDGTQN